jgi:dTMP kinase
MNRFITFEGVYGSGKSSLLTLLSQKLKGSATEFVFTCEPGFGEFGKDIRKLLSDRILSLDAATQFFLFAADRANHFSKLVLPAIARGAFVFSDRSVDSSYIYQGIVGRLDLNFIHQANLVATKNLLPSLTFYFRINSKTAVKRITRRKGGDQFGVDKERFLKKLIYAYDLLFVEKKYPQIISGREIVVINAEIDQNDLLAVVLDKLKIFFGSEFDPF